MTYSNESIAEELLADFSGRYSRLMQLDVQRCESIIRREDARLMQWSVETVHCGTINRIDHLMRRLHEMCERIPAAVALDGELGLEYIGLYAILVSFIQLLDMRLCEIESNTRAYLTLI